MYERSDVVANGRYLSPEECSRAACVCRLWRSLIDSDESLWGQRCAERFALQNPMDIKRQPLPSFR